MGVMAVLMIVSCSQNKKEVESNATVADAVKVEEYVFQTDSLKRYEFPTHINDLVIDRAKSKASEVFMVIVEPGKSVIHHKHDDTEQIFYMLQGTGFLCIGEEKKEYAVKPGDVIRIPMSTLHSIKTDSNENIKYLCVDCFASKPLESSWDEHVKVVCTKNGWDFNQVVQ